MSKKNRDIALKNYLSEHVNTFLLVGYDVDGEAVIIDNINNDRDMDAIMTFITKVAEDMQSDYDPSSCEEIDSILDEDNDT